MAQWGICAVVIMISVDAQCCLVLSVLVEVCNALHSINASSLTLHDSHHPRGNDKNFCCVTASIKLVRGIIENWTFKVRSLQTVCMSLAHSLYKI